MFYFTKVQEHKSVTPKICGGKEAGKQKYSVYVMCGSKQIFLHKCSWTEQKVWKLLLQNKSLRKIACP